MRYKGCFVVVVLFLWDRKLVAVSGGKSNDIGCFFQLNEIQLLCKL